MPKALQGARIIALDLASLLARTRYRGEFEGRLHAVLREVTNQSRPTVFLDEFHLIARAGAAEGGLDMDSLLLAAMARGEIALIGATTPREFKEHISGSGPLARRVQIIDVPEASRRETLGILRGVRAGYESHNFGRHRRFSVGRGGEAGCGAK